MGLIAGREKALVVRCFGAWSQWMTKAQAEKEIREKFEKQITDAEMTLIQYKEKQVSNIRNVIMRNAEQGNMEAVNMTLQAWIAETAHMKHEKEMEEEKKRIEAKLAGAQANAGGNAKKALTR